MRARLRQRPLVLAVVLLRQLHLGTPLIKSQFEIKLGLRSNAVPDMAAQPSTSSRFGLPATGQVITNLEAAAYMRL